MPQNTNHRKTAAPSSSNQKKKKKGHAPTHQNTFAFKHNPNSRKTQKILEMPNTHVCRRCHDKIEWRKQYRKYKPRTQPGKCNICQQRRVMAAYHTVCETCTLSQKAKKSVRDHLGMLPEEAGVEALEISTQDKDEETPEEEPVSAAVGGAEGAASTTTSNSCNNSAADSCSKSQNNSQQQQQQQEPQTDGRACAMCVKEWALPDSDDDEEEDPLASGRRIPLRQRKTLERQREKQMNAKRRKPREENDEDEEDDDGSQNSNRNDDSEEDDFGSDNEDDSNHVDDEKDPFLKAVGGADKLLTGEAYQQALLQKEQMLKMQGNN